jgi:hypothetical protein
MEKENKGFRIIKSTNPEYYLVNSEGIMIATSSITEGLQKLSKENCDEIFGVIDVEKLAEENYPSGDDWTEEQSLIRKLAFKNGFKKAMELNKDKLFTLEDVLDAWELGATEGLPLTKSKKEKLLESLKEIEVEIEMESTRTIHAMTDKGIKTFTQKEKLDENGCLILTKTKI